MISIHFLYGNEQCIEKIIQKVYGVEDFSYRIIRVLVSSIRDKYIRDKIVV